MKLKTVAAFIAAVLLLTAGIPFVAAEEAIELTFWHSMSEEAGVLMNQYVREFNETVGAEKGIEVELVYQGQYSESVNKMNNMLSGRSYDTLPDVMQMDATGKVNYFASGVAYTADDAARATGIFPACSWACPSPPPPPCCFTTKRCWTA